MLVFKCQARPECLEGNCPYTAVELLPFIDLNHTTMLSVISFSLSLFRYNIIFLNEK